MSGKRIMMLTGRGTSSNIMYNGLADIFNIVCVIVEDPPSKSKLIRRRLKKLGLLTVVGQLVFQSLFIPFLSFFSRSRKREIFEKNSLSNEKIDSDKLTHVTSVNSKEVIDLLNNINPDIVIVNGTRIISNKVLMSTDAIFINTHVGITPKYRGVHGGYWALAQNDKENCGVTIHKIDSGIDTGSIIMQDRIEITEFDNFTTYPLLQLNKGIQLMTDTIHILNKGNVVFQNSEGPSKLWYHPTIWGYLYRRIVKSVK